MIGLVFLKNSIRQNLTEEARAFPRCTECSWARTVGRQNPRAVNPPPPKGQKKLRGRRDDGKRCVTHCQFSMLEKNAGDWLTVCDADQILHRWDPGEGLPLPHDWLRRRNLKSATAVSRARERQARGAPRATQAKRLARKQALIFLASCAPRPPAFSSTQREDLQAGRKGSRVTKGMEQDAWERR